MTKAIGKSKCGSSQILSHRSKISQTDFKHAHSLLFCLSTLLSLVMITTAMEMMLTGRNMKADEAERSGLVSRVVPHDTLMDEAMKTASSIASLSLPVVKLCKDAVNSSFETTLEMGEFQVPRAERCIWQPAELTSLCAFPCMQATASSARCTRRRSRWTTRRRA